MVAALNRFMARLSSSNETLRAFMAEAAHQMRTPLAALRAQAQLAMDDDDPRDMQRSLVAIERNASHMSRLLNQLLSDASVIHRANLQRFATVDLVELLHQALHDALPRGEEAPRVHLAIDPQPALLRGDALLLREALKNLIDNACKYGAGAPLQVALTSDGHQHVLTIADHGPGIPRPKQSGCSSVLCAARMRRPVGRAWAWRSSSAWSRRTVAASICPIASAAG